MIKSIQHFEEVGVKNLEKVLKDFVKEPDKQAEFIYGITAAVVQLGLDMIKETFESMDEELRDMLWSSLFVTIEADKIQIILLLHTVP